MAATINIRQAKSKLWAGAAIFVFGLTTVGLLASLDLAGILWLLGAALGFFFVFIIIVVIFFQSLEKKHKDFFGLITPETIWSAEVGQWLTPSQLGSFAKASQGDAQTRLGRVTSVYRGTVGDVEYKAAEYLIYQQDPVEKNMTEVVFRLPKPIAGTLMIHRIENPLSFGGDEMNLESIDFNKKTIVRASNRSLPYEVLAPDLMLWYLETKFAPPIKIDHDKGIIVFLVTMNLQEVLVIVEKMLLEIRTSGALR